MHHLRLVPSRVCKESALQVLYQCFEEDPSDNEELQDLKSKGDELAEEFAGKDYTSEEFWTNYCDTRNWQLGINEKQTGKYILGLDAGVNDQCKGNERSSGVCPGYNRLALSAWSFCRNFAYVVCAAGSRTIREHAHACRPPPSPGTC